MDLNERLTGDSSQRNQTSAPKGQLGHRMSGMPKFNKFERTEIFATVAFLLILLNGLNHLQTNLLCVRADDSAAAPAFDINALASLASNLGSNTQIMSLVSNLLNPGGQQKPGVGSAGGLQGEMSDVDSNSIDRQGSEPLRRGMRMQSVAPPAPPPPADQAPGAKPQDGPAPPASPPASPPTQAPQPTAAAAAPAGPTPTGQPAGAPPSAGSSSNPLGGIMSMLPNILSGLSSGGSGGSLNLGALSGLLGLNKLTPSPPPATEAGPTTSPAASPPSAPKSASPPSNSPASAQQVINQVLTAYASGQIPNELIQLGLSGRVPPQIIELALSGQVPIDMIKMVITGQVPMSTINTFLGAIQQASQPPPAQAGAAGSRSSSPSNGGSGGGSSPGIFSTTRSLFEALIGLGRSKGGDSSSSESSKPSIKVPTLIGPIPIKMPSMPNMRNFGQLVGGTITNFSSMIPF